MLDWDGYRKCDQQTWLKFNGRVGRTEVMRFMLSVGENIIRIQYIKTRFRQQMFLVFFIRYANYSYTITLITFRLSVNGLVIDV